MRPNLQLCDQTCGFLRIWSHLLKESLVENFIFCAVNVKLTESSLEVYSEPCQTSKIECSAKIGSSSKTVKYFHKTLHHKCLKVF